MLQMKLPEGALAHGETEKGRMETTYIDYFKCSSNEAGEMLFS